VTADRSAAAPTLLETQSRALRRLMPPLDGFAIGGSHGRGTADAYSDLDFFLVVPDAHFWDFVHDFPALIEHPRPVASSGVGRFMSDYGYRIGFILSDASKVEYFFNSPNTMTSLPLSARLTVLEDRSGYLTGLLERAEEEFRADRRPSVAAGVHDCLLEIHDLRKHASRGDLLPMLWRLTTLRRPALALHHMRTSGDVYAPSSAASRLASRQESRLAERVDAIVPALDRASIAAAYCELRAVMLDAWRHFATTGVPTPEQFRIEAELSEDVLRQLRA
jgi:hypothetical protein